MAIQIAIMAACLLMSAYFSATETAFLSINKTRLKTMVENGNKRAALVLKLEEKLLNLRLGKLHRGRALLAACGVVEIKSSALFTFDHS